MDPWTFLCDIYTIEILETNMLCPIELTVYKNNTFNNKFLIYGCNALENFLFFFKDYNFINKNNFYYTKLYDDVKLNIFLMKLNDFEAKYNNPIF